VKDAANGVKWPEYAVQQDGILHQTFKTQKRHIKLWMTLFGLLDLENANEQYLAASTLEIDTICLVDAANMARDGPTYKGRAQAIMGILKQHDRFPKTKKILERGHQCSLWGRPI